MNVREALEKAIEEPCDARDKFFLDALAPVIERALVAAYNEGIYDVEVHSAGNSDHGVTAGVAAMMEDRLK